MPDTGSRRLERLLYRDQGAAHLRDLEQASDNYEQAEADFLALVRRRASWAELTTAAQAVADASAEFNHVAFAALHAGTVTAWMPLDDLTERTEVLAELWADVAAAYRTE